MTLPTIRPEQHGQILGFATIGYGVANIIELIVPLFQARHVSSQLQQNARLLSDLSSGMGDVSTPSVDIGSFFLPTILTRVSLFILSVVTGIIILSRQTNPRGLGLTLAVLIFGFFPLGTLLSLYILIYLFVIDTGEYQSEPTVNTVHLNG